MRTEDGPIERPDAVSPIIVAAGNGDELEERSLLDYGRVLLRHRLLFLFVVLAVLAASIGATFLSADRYEASSDVLIRTGNNDSLFPLSGAASGRMTRVVQTELQFIESDFFQSVVEGQSANATVSVQLTDEDQPNNGSITFVASSGSAVDAAAAANLWAATYVTARHESVVADRQATLTTLEAEIAELQAEIDVLREPLNNIDEQIAVATEDGDSLTVSQLTTTRILLQETLSGQLNPLEANLRQLQNDVSQITLDLTFLEDPNISALVSVSAAEPSSPVSSGLVRNAALGLVAGLVLAVMVVLIFDSVADRVSSTEDIEQALPGTRVMGSTPMAKGKGADRDAPLLHIASSASITEAYQQVFTSLQFHMLQSGARVIQVTSTNASEGKSTLSASLAILAARQGSKVLVVGADLRKPVVGDALNVANRVGLTSVLEGRDRLSDVALESPDNPGVTVIPSGPSVDDPAGLLRGGLIEPIFEEIKRWPADLIIVDSPPVLAVTDASLIAPHVDSILYVVRSGSTRRSQIRHALSRLDLQSTRVGGVVLTGARTGGGNYGYGYY